jgi:hypothetical protein
METNNSFESRSHPHGSKTTLTIGEANPHSPNQLAMDNIQPPGVLWLALTRIVYCPM